jgi:hypothetical protein
MGLHAAFGEEAQRLARIGALLDAEDLDFHAMTVTASVRPFQSAPARRIA